MKWTQWWRALEASLTQRNTHLLDKRVGNVARCPVHISCLSVYYKSTSIAQFGPLRATQTGFQTSSSLWSNQASRQAGGFDKLCRIYSPNLHELAGIYLRDFFFSHLYAPRALSRAPINVCNVTSAKATLESLILWFDYVLFAVRVITLWASLGEISFKRRQQQQTVTAKRIAGSINICFEVLAFMIITAEQHWSVFTTVRLIKSCTVFIHHLSPASVSGFSNRMVTLQLGGFWRDSDLNTS